MAQMHEKPEAQDRQRGAKGDDLMEMSVAKISENLRAHRFQPSFEIALALVAFILNTSKQTEERLLTLVANPSNRRG